jgi:hypothetical protein
MMARRKEQAEEVEQPQMVRHPLLVYYNMGKRYRGPGLMLFLLGPFLTLPSFVDELDRGLVDKDALAIIGGVITLAGLGLLLLSILAKRRAYVLCKSDILEIRTPFYRTFVSYLRIKQVLSVQVSQLFPRESLKGASKPLMTPLLGMTAAELYVTSWPAPKKRLMRYMGKFLFSPRAEAWVFIVPNYSVLIRQIETAQLSRIDEASGKATAYEDPFERLKYYKK